MNKKLLNEQGLTLVELLVVSVLFAIISIFVGSLIINSSDTTKKIQIETQFRDEADLIMSNLIRTMYETKKSNIISLENNPGNSYINVTNDPTKCQRDENGILPTDCDNTLEIIGFITEEGETKLHLKNEDYVLSNENIRILPNSRIIENSDGTYEITLILQYRTTRGGNEVLKTMEFVNTIQPF